MEKDKKKKKTVRKPSFILWYIFGPLVVLWFKLTVKFTRNKVKIDKGSLIIAPHRSYFDFFILPIAVYPKRVHVVSTTYWFRNKKLAVLLNILGVIPKDQYRADLKAIMKINEVLKRGENVLIFPEGQMSPYGNSLFLPNGLDKLIKKFKPSVYFVNTSGSYLNSPKWNLGLAKRGHIDCYTTKLFDKAELDNVTLDDINNKINEYFNTNNDLEWIKEHPTYKYIKKEKIKGLENIILACPECKTQLPFEYKNEKITCKSCGFELQFSKENYNFENNKIKDLEELFNITNGEFNKTVDNGLVLEDEAKIVYYDENLDEVLLFNGIVKMDKNKVYFINPINTEENIEIENNKIINMVNTLNKSFEVPTPTHTYRIYTKNKRNCILYWNYLASLKEREKDASKNQ